MAGPEGFRPSHQEPPVERTHTTPRIVGIFTSPAKGEPMIAHESIKALAGKGLEGDRYANNSGAWSGVRIPNEMREVSLITVDGITKANATLVEAGIAPFSTEETRRNIVIDDLPFEALNELVGKQFSVGSIFMLGTELCTPCTRPPIVLKRGKDGKAFETAFAEKGGLRARIINDGEIHKKDIFLEDPYKI